MKPNAVLVNTSRGGVIDQNALAEALEQKWIFGAGLDVTDPEPLPDDSILRLYDNCLILPHIDRPPLKLDRPCLKWRLAILLLLFKANRCLIRSIASD